MELVLDCTYIWENVCVIKFQIIQYQGARFVVHKLRSPIKVAGIVLVRFNDKERGFAQAS